MNPQATPIDDDVRRAIGAAFPDDAAPAVLEFLRRYEGREARRVYLAILVLADGNPAEVDRLVAASNLDHRDSLYWAEFPEESAGGPNREMARRYQKLGVEVPPSLLDDADPRSIP